MISSKSICLALATWAGAGLVIGQEQVQGYAPPTETLTETKSGVLPVLPTPFSGVETLQGAIVNKGPMNSTFVGLEGPAEAQDNQPQATYMAMLPATMFNPYVETVISGSIMAVGMDQGVMFTVNITGLPDASYGPFVYHIHDMAVPEDGNCTETMGHLDPTNRGEYYPCDKANPASCQAGDLAGKHGMIMAEGNFSASYMEPYLSMDSSSDYYFGDKSIVIHTSNTTRLTCANFTQSNSSSSPNATSTGGGSGGATSTGGMTGSPTSSPSAIATAGASAVSATVVGFVGAFFVAMMAT